MYTYRLLVLLLIPTMLLSMETDSLQGEKESLFEALDDPCQDGKQAYIKTMVRSNPDYATCIHTNGCTPLWTLVDSLHKGRSFIASHVNQLYGKTSQGNVEEMYKELFIFLLQEGATIDFSDCPTSLNLCENDVPEVLRNTWYDFIWRKARRALIECKGDELAQYLEEYSFLLDTPCTDTGTTLLHEATMNFKKETGELNKQAFGMFRLLLSKGANATVPNDGGVTVEQLMANKDGEGNYVSPGAELFHYEDNLLEVPTINFGSFIPSKNVKGFVAAAYQKASEYKEYAIGGGVLVLLGYLMFGGPSKELPPFDAQVLG